MALTDEQMQDLQKVTKKSAVKKEGDRINNVGESKQDYEVVASVDSVTQGIAVAPIDENGNADYSQTAIVVAGTQTPLDENGNGQGNQWNSFGRAIRQGAYSSGYISEEDKKYLDKHAHIYSDQGNSVSILSRDLGDIPYGDVREVEGSNHKTSYAHIKGNSLDIDYYVKNGILCSGMTEEQVKKVASIGAKKDADDFIRSQPNNQGLSANREFLEKQFYEKKIKNYEKDYGPYADKKGGKSKQTSSLLDNWELHALGTKVGGLATLLGAAGGGQQIFLKTEMLVALASQAMAQFAGFEAKFLAELEEAKEEVRRQCEEAKQRCLQAGPHLSSGEIEALMAPIQFEHVWDSGAEADIRAMLQSLKSQMTEISTHLVTSSERFSASDNTAAVQFM